MIGRTLDAWQLFDPAARRGNELGIVSIDSEMEIERHDDLASFLEASMARARAEKESNDFATASRRRADEMERTGMVIVGFTTATFSPDGRIVATLGGGTINLFDVANAATRDGGLYAPWLRTFESPVVANAHLAPPDRLAFGDNGATVLRLTEERSFAFDVASGEARDPAKVTTAPPRTAAFDLSNRFRKAQGLKLTPRKA